MKKYKVICHPIQNRYCTIVEADSIEEAIKIAEEEAQLNCGFSALSEDVKEIK